MKESSSSKKLSVKFRREMQKILNDMRKNLLEDINNTMKTESNHLKFDVGDFYDNASSDRERELSLSLSQRDRQKLNQIEDALKRLEAKTYGQCLMCKDLISEDRLKVMPFTVYCVACLEEEEASNSN
jgi:DnaK suppressor protein